MLRAMSGSSDRDVGDTARALKTAVWSLPISVLTGAIVWLEFLDYGAVGFVLGLLGAALAFAFTAGGAWLFTELAGRLTETRGLSTPSVADFSLQKSLVARGRTAEAIDSYEAHLALHPTDAAAYLLLADLYAAEQKPLRAIDLWRVTRELPGC